MDEAAAAFAGALVGSLFTIFFARRTAIDQALGQQWAVRRVELVERLSIAVGEALAFMDVTNGDPNPSAFREPSKLQDEFDELRRRADLYLSDALWKAIAPIDHWVRAEIDSAGVTKNEYPQPDQDAITLVYQMLAEAIEGKHGRLPWYRRF